MNRSQLLLAVAALGAGGLLAAPAAHAASCTVNGENLRLFQPNGRYTVTVNANKAALGPGAVAVISSGEVGTYGKASGSIKGNTVDFTITWDNNKGTARFTGTVGADGVAHGTATGNSVPINLWNPGPWDSTETLNCDGNAAPAGTATVKKLSDVYSAPDGNGNRLGPKTYFLAVGRQLPLVEPCRNNWCHLVITDPEVPGGKGWVYAGEGFLQVP